MSNIFTTTERHEIAGRARTIHERLTGPANEPGGEPPIDPDQILDDWRAQFPNADAFQTRLEYDDMSTTDVRKQIEATRWPSDEPLPEWIETLEELVHYIEENPIDGYRSTPEDTPFIELLATIAEYARERVSDVPVNQEALSPMVDGLIARLDVLSVRPLYVEFKSFIEYHDPELATADPDEFEELPTEYYDQFVEAMFEHGFKSLCAEYPVLARQLTRIIDDWVDAVTQLCQRIRADREILRDRFDIDGEVIELDPLADDTHAEGRVPVRVSFESSAVVYKPRDVDAGIVFYTILDRLEDHLPTQSFRKPTYVSRDGYGWMELITYSDPSDDDAVTRYYERSGAVLCAAYALNLTDCQFENVISAGEHPMIIDAETLCHPHVDADARPTPSEISTVAYRSVLSTLLMSWSVGDPRDTHDETIGVSHAGFGSSSETQLGEQPQPRIKAANTDVMVVEERQPKVDLSTNTPTVDGIDQPPSAHIEALTRGFTEMYETIQALNADGQLFSEVATYEIFDGIENRLVYRATAQYGSVLRSAAGRDPLRDGARLTVEFEQLVAPFFGDRINADDYLPLYDAERRALRRRDVPRFASSPTQRTLFHDGEPLEITVETSGYNKCQQRIRSMNTTDQDRQVWLTEYAFSPKSVDPGPPPTADLSTNHFQQEAIDLFDDVINAAVVTDDHNRWVSITPTDSGLRLYPTDSSLYHGRGGIALTAAALYKVTDHDRYRQFAIRTLEPVLEGIENDSLPVELGGLVGLGSVIYTLSVVADLLDSDRYRTAAMQATHAVTDAHVSNDDTFEVMGGSAGTLLGLLAYYDRYGGPDVLDRAILCGDRLLEGRVTVGSQRTWKTAEQKPPLTGFSHGASGISYALARLAATTGEERFAVGARDGLEFESTLFDPGRTNWAKSQADDECVDKWCHGRSGMALARIGISEHLGDEDLRADANAALDATAAAPPSNMDHLCCGNLGRAEALLVGSRRGCGNYSDAIELAQRCLTRRDRAGALSMTGHSESFTNPMFFHGLSGAAYTLLRLQFPDQLPCVLLLE